VTGQTVLVHGIVGGVGSLAAQLVRWGGATVIGTVRRGADLGQVETLLPLESAAQAHDRVGQGTCGRVLLAIPD
jgi:NADPH2:quinone reductase